MTVDLLEALTRVWTLDDLDELDALPDGRYEIVDRRLIRMATPSWAHDFAAMEIAVALRVAPPHLAVLGASGVGLDLFNMRSPDALVVFRSSLRRVRHIGGPEDVSLAVEVMSPSSRTEDRITKPRVYADAGIPHFWRFEPDDELLMAWELVNGDYVEVGRATGDEELTVTRPFPVTIRPSDLLPD